MTANVSKVKNFFRLFICAKIDPYSNYLDGNIKYSLHLIQVCQEKDLALKQKCDAPRHTFIIASFNASVTVYSFYGPGTFLLSTCQTHRLRENEGTAEWLNNSR